MAKVVTESFRIESTNEFVNSFGLDAGNEYYIMGSSIDKQDEISNTQSSIREFQRRVIFGNKLTPTNVRFMFNINPWTSGTVYDSFDDTQDMSTKNFYVTVLDGPINETSYKVFKCIRNNNRSPSISIPSTALEENIYETTEEDGYVWQFLFAVPPADYIQFATSAYLPYVENQFVKENAKQGIGDIVIETVPAGHFSGFIIGSSTSPSGAVLNSATRLNETTYQVEIICEQETKATSGSYANMIFRIPGEGGADGNVYEIIDSYASNDVTQTKRVNLYIKTPSFDQTRINSAVEIVPKINITSPDDVNGTQAVAYGVINSEGTLTAVNFKDKGSGYNFATATLQEPGKSVPTTVENSKLRVIHTPTGGHGSNPVHELFMSRVETVTNFISDVTTNTPSTNTYTKVGLVKNPQFEKNPTAALTTGATYKITNIGGNDDQPVWNTIAGTQDVVYSVGDIFVCQSIQTTDGGEAMTLPSTFDNRVTLTVLNSLLTPAQAQQGFYVEQTHENGQVASGIIHEVQLLDFDFDGTDDSTRIHLVDTSGDFSVNFNSNINITIKEDKDSTSTTLADFNIDSVDLEIYQPYSGELLHFVDFDPITRTDSSKEKIKLIFDF